MMTINPQIFMRRCFELAQRSTNSVKTNPNVGCVIVHNDRIIGEGYHHMYGDLHAERDALRSINEDDKKLLSKSTLYVSLEPCNHHGKTPPCIDTILSHHIPEVYISCLDPNEKMQGQSVRLLRANGVTVHVGLLRELGQDIIAPYKVQLRQERPYIILKYAQSADGFIGQGNKQVWLSNLRAKVLVHQWRAEIDGILIGTNTAIADNPKLTTRMVKGTNPCRVVLDRMERIPKGHNLLADGLPTWIITQTKNYKAPNNVRIFQIEELNWNLKQIFNILYDNGIYRLLVEGGGQILQNVISNNMWDQARIIKTQVELKEGIKAPSVKGQLIREMELDNNKALIINNLTL